MIFVSILVAGVVSTLDPGLDTTAGRVVSQVLIAAVFAGTAGAFALSATRGSAANAARELGLGRPVPRQMLRGALAWLLYLAIAALLAPLLAPDQEDITRELGTDEGSAIGLLLAGFLIVLVAPLSEELFFRGFVFGGLRRGIGVAAAAVVSAMLWGSLHLASGNIGTAVQLTIFGVILALLFAREGSLWPAIFAHLLNNAVAFALLVSS